MVHKKKKSAGKKHRICMVSDFFYPNTGGVESHIYQLSQGLIAKGHKVVVITHAYGNRTGVRYITQGLKIYYIPVWVVYNQSALPTFFTTLPIMRCIFIRERISIVHGHSAFSTLAHEAMFHAKTMGLKTVFTDHSLFGFADSSAIITNKLLQMTMTICNQVICVSHTGKENTALRARVRSDLISVIPNAVDTAIFTPDPTKRDIDKITVVVISRLVYRKGVDLIAGVIPVLCSRYDNVCFIIGGDGPKRSVLEEMREQCGLQERVSILGAIENEKVRDVLVRGDIFLNASLTEAFCMAIVEAASCGLQVVSTSVGGVPEVLPPEFIWLTDASVTGLLEGLEKAIADRRKGKIISPLVAHQRVSEMYQWKDIVIRTEKVYDKASCEPVEELPERLKKFRHQGMAGVLFMILQTIEHFLLLMVSFFTPEEDIDICHEFRL